MTSNLEVSLIVTVRNEAHSIDAFLDSLFRQSRLPDEVVLVDGGSIDGTVSRIRGRAEYERRIQLIEAPHVNIARG